jgi:hypothetical protein
MSSLVDALLQKLPIPIEGASVEKYDKGFKLRVPVDVIAKKLKEEIHKSFVQNKVPIPPGVIDIRAEGNNIVLDVRVV